MASNLFQILAMLFISFFLTYCIAMKPTVKSGADPGFSEGGLESEVDLEGRR